MNRIGSVVELKFYIRMQEEDIRMQEEFVKVESWNYGLIPNPIHLLGQGCTWPRIHVLTIVQGVQFWYATAALPNMKLTN